MEDKSLLDWVIDLTLGAIWSVFATAYGMLLIFVRFSWLDLGLMVYNTLLSVLFIIRRPAVRYGPWPDFLLAGGAVLLSIEGYHRAPGGYEALGSVIAGVGLLAASASLLSLGRSVGIVPADRGLQTRGMYALVRHPMYASELLFGVGYCLGNPSRRNWVTWLLLVVCQVGRALREERILASPEYDAYCQRVRWRFLPGVW